MIKLKIRYLFISLGFLFVASLFTINVLADTASTAVTVGNATPVASATNFNESAVINLTENTTSTYYATTTITDNNGCDDIFAVYADFYRGDLAAADCDTVGEEVYNYCRPRVTCTVVSGYGNTCDSGTDTSAEYECQLDLSFYADPYATWIAGIQAGDGSATTSVSSDTDTAEVASTAALNVTSSISYSTVAANSNTGVVNSTTTITNTGNIALDTEFSGDVMCKDDYPTCVTGSTPMTPAQQEYSLAPFAYTAGTDLVATTSPTTVQTILPKNYSTTTPITDDISWGIGIPVGTETGDYTGQNTFTAVAD